MNLRAHSSCLALAVFVLVACPGRSALAAEADLLKLVKAPPGWKVSLFAAPPDISYPTCLSAAPGGDLFVGLDENGSLDAKADRGRVVRCTDTDGDGKADQFITFARMDSPRGLWFDRDTLYVMHPPLLTAFHDDNGDGQADRQEVLVRGLGFDLKFRGADHTVNGMRMGIDGFLYIAVGDYGTTNAVGKDDTALQLYGGGVVRVRPDGSGLEVVSRGQRNIYDVAVSPELDLFTRDNTNDGDGWDVRLSHVILGGEYGYPRLFKRFGAEIIQPLAEYGGGSPCGALFMDEPGFPEGFGRALYTVEWGRGGILRHPLTPNGAGWKAGQEKFIDLPRPTDMDVDGSGRIYITSWHGATFNYNGPNAGFVIQVGPEGRQVVPYLDLQKAKDEALLRSLASASAVARLDAQREILRRKPGTDFATALEKLAKENESSAVRFAAIFTLQQLLGTKANDALVRLAKLDSNREFALRALADDLRNAAAVPTQPFVTALTDANPRVRLQAATALGRLGRRESAAALLPLVADADPLVVHAAVHSLVALRAGAVGLSAFDSPGQASLQPGAARVLQALHEPAVVEGIIGKLETSTDGGTRELLWKTLARLYHREADWDGKWWGTRPDTTGPYFKPTPWAGSEKIGTVLQQALAKADAATLRFLVVELQKNRVDLPEVTPMVLKLAREDVKFRPIAVEMFSGRATLPEEAIPAFGAVASDAAETPAVRAKAVRALMKSGKPAALDAAIAALTCEEKPPGELGKVWEEFARDPRQAQRVERFSALAGSGSSASERTLGLAVLASMATAKLSSKEARSTASAFLEKAWAKPETAVPLLQAIAKLRLDGYATQVRGLVTHPSPAVASAAKSAVSALKLDEATTSGEALLEKLRYEDIVATANQEKGNVRRGADVFTKAGCTACHTTSSEDAPKGPFLGGIATRYSRADLCESILKPSAKIAQGFETQWFKTKDDDEWEGFVTREGGDDLDVRNIAGITTTLAKKDIKERGQRETSMMPAGLLDKLTVRELASLLAYLESLKGK